MHKFCVIDGLRVSTMQLGFQTLQRQMKREMVSRIRKKTIFLILKWSHKEITSKYRRYFNRIALNIAGAAMNFPEISSNAFTITENCVCCGKRRKIISLIWVSINLTNYHARRQLRFASVRSTSISTDLRNLRAVNPFYSSLFTINTKIDLITSIAELRMQPNTTLTNEATQATRRMDPSASLYRSQSIHRFNASNVFERITKSEQSTINECKIITNWPETIKFSIIKCFGAWFSQQT